jgi:hypothetical protein
LINLAETGSCQCASARHNTPIGACPFRDLISTCQLQCRTENLNTNVPSPAHEVGDKPT